MFNQNKAYFFTRMFFKLLIIFLCTVMLGSYAIAQSTTDYYTMNTTPNNPSNNLITHKEIS
ncbi:MAG: hypothetical protein ACRCWR_08840, partial [Saezia sp.]